MHKYFKPQPTLLSILIAALGSPASGWTAQLSLAQYPAGTAYKAPIPNVILSVDTSGSMNFCDVNGSVIGNSNGTQSNNCYTNSMDLRRITFVKNGLRSLLIDSNKYDGQFRLAWQSFACNDIPSSNGNCNNDNAAAKFTGTHRSNFGNWASRLTATGSTPSPVLAWNAGKYLQTTGAASPWNATPGTADSAPLACRRSYHIFLTDGGWNYNFGDISGTSFETDMKIGTLTSRNSTAPAAPDNTKTISNFDGKSIPALPTPGPATSTHPASPYGVKAYSADSTTAETKIYQDAYGTRVVNTRSSSGGFNPTYTFNYYAYPSMADIAFYFWATDLQPTIPNEVIPKVRKTGTENFTNGNRNVTFSEYWNPKNDSAEWQHLTQYTIGYGTSASNLPQVNNTSPQWSGGTFDMYGTGFSSLAVGNTYWDDPTSSTADGNSSTAGYDAVRPQEMWHMAINSRGKFYPVTGGDLTSVFADIFDDIIVDTTAPISGFTSASGSVSRVGTQSFQTTYIAADDPNSLDNRWYGYVTADSISTSGATSPFAGWGLTSARKNITTADKLDAIDPADLGSRLILSYDILSTNANKGVSFKWANLSTATTAASARMWLNKGTIGTTSTFAGDAKGEDRLNFIRGDRTKEASRGGAATFRNRKSRQGDIVNSNIWYVGPPSSGYASSSYRTFAANNRTRLAMVYVGGNDGMLHGFSAENGSEKIAYVPHGVIQNLAKLADRSDPEYSHQYYVDGSPMSSDINIGTTDSANWRTYLASTLGAGGRGYFVLDVTKPGPADGTSTVTSDFSETNARNLVVMDKTAAAVNDAVLPSKPADTNAHADIGHIFGTPVVAESNQQRALHITQTNDNRWALILGNGYNSLNERPVLLIQYLDGNKELKTIPAATSGVEASGNGLSTPQFLDVNADGKPDFVYAGDLRGNLWKFDISSATASNWGVAFNGSPLFTATYSTTTGSSSRQPITAPPVLRANSVAGGLMVAFGTGQNLTDTDRTDRSTQSVYSILDNTQYTIASTGDDVGKVTIATSPTPAAVGDRSSLTSQSVNDTSKTAGTGDSASRTFWKLTTQEVVYACAANAQSCTAKKGWYIDLPVPGERVYSSLDFYDGSNILEILSEVPASGSATASGQEVCAPTPQSAQPFRTLINITSGKSPTPPVMNVDGNGYTSANAGFARMTASSKELRIATRGEQVRKGNDGKVDKLARLPELLLRPTWRQLK